MCAGEFSRCLLWAHDEMLFPAGSTIVAMGSGGKQRQLLGHTRPVVALALDAAASLLASAEEGTEGAIKLWDVAGGKCLATLGGKTCLC